jgi:hypothetical protein
MQLESGLNFEWVLTFNGQQNTFRDLTGADFNWLAHNNMLFEGPTAPLQALLLYDRLLIAETFCPTDLDAADYLTFIKLFFDKVLRESVYSPETFLEMVWFVEGQKFSPDLEKWFDKPITLMKALAAVARKYPPTKLI